MDLSMSIVSDAGPSNENPVLVTNKPMTEGLDSHPSSGPDDIPDGVIKTGISPQGEGYVGIVQHNGITLPCKIIPQYGLCYFSHGGQELSLPTYSFVVLKLGYSYEWVESGEGNVPPNAATLGTESSDGEYFIFGRVTTDGERHIGRILPEHKSCFFPKGGLEHQIGYYDTLVIKRAFCDLIGCDLRPGFSLYRSKRNDDFPPNPIEAGMSPCGMIYVGFAEYGDRNFKDVKGKYDCGPAKMNKSYQATFYPYGGKEHFSTNHMFICIEPGYTYKWVSDTNGHVPANAVRLGRKYNGENYFVGKFKIAGEECVGKISTSEGCCYAGFSWHEQKRTTYEVLVVKKEGEEDPEETEPPQPQHQHLHWHANPGLLFDHGQSPEYEMDDDDDDDIIDVEPYGGNNAAGVPENWTRKPFIVNNDTHFSRRFIDKQLKELEDCLEVNEGENQAEENAKERCAVCQINTPTRIVCPCGHNGLCRNCVEQIIRQPGAGNSNMDFNFGEGGNNGKKAVTCPVCRCLVYNFLIEHKTF